MVGKQEQGDASCRHCGAPIYFEVGPGVSNCPACGKDWQHSDDEVEERRRKMAEPTDWKAEMQSSLDSLKFTLDSIIEAPTELKVPLNIQLKAHRLKRHAEQMQYDLDFHDGRL